MKYNVSCNCMLVSHQIYPNFTNESVMSHVLVRSYWLPGWCWFAVSHRCQKGQWPGGFWSDANPIWMDMFFCKKYYIKLVELVSWLNWLNWFHSICWTSYVFQDLDGNSGWMLFFLVELVSWFHHSFAKLLIIEHLTTFNNQHQFLTWINIQKYPILHTMKLFVEYRMDSSQLVPLLVHLNIS